VRRAPDQVGGQRQERRVDEQDLVVIAARLTVTVRTGGVLKRQVAWVLDVLPAIPVELSDPACLQADGQLIRGAAADLLGTAHNVNSCSRIAEQVRARAEFEKLNAVPHRPRWADVPDPLRHFAVIEGGVKRVVPIARRDVLAVQDQHRGLPLYPVGPDRARGRRKSRGEMPYAAWKRRPKSAGPLNPHA
jgi:hypothetical protein